MKLLLKTILIIILPILIIACSSFYKKKISNEMVMTEGMVILATTNMETIKIEAGKGFKRTFTWAGGSRSVTLWPRKERWNGSLGLYFPGVGNHWEKHDGITRAIIEEGHLYFSSLEKLLSYIDQYKDKRNLVYSDKGLFVYWEKTPGAGGTLSVKIWQLFVNGNRPSKIPGSNNNLICMSILN